MALYIIRRDLGDTTREELDAAAYRALMCAYDFDRMRWLRSFWDSASGEIYCVYEADSEKDVFEHARRARIPCNEVREVTEISPELYVHG